MRKVLLSTLLAAFSWAVAPSLLLGALLALDAAIELLGGEFSFADKSSTLLVVLSLGWTLSGLSLALVLRAWYPSMSWSRISLIGIPWGALVAAGLIVGFIPVVFLIQGAGEMSALFLAAFLAVICLPLPWGFAGAIGGGLTMFILRHSAPAIRWNDVIASAVGWGLGFLLGGISGALALAVSLILGLFSLEAGRLLVAPVFILGLGGGALGGGVMFWRLGRLPAQSETPGDSDESSAQPPHTERTLTRAGIGLLVMVVMGACLATAVVTASQALPHVPKDERAVLEAFYESTSGERWQDNTGWLSWKSPCRWQGVYCRDEDGQWYRYGGSPFSMHIGSLFLNGNRLSGAIPPELGALANLTHLRLEDNQLTGSIPPEWGALASLEHFYLSGNQLSGPIPPALGALANLKVIHFDDNQLSGSIPPELGTLANLETLHLGGNQLSGPIPPELGALANLETLHLGDNQLGGSVPPELGDLPKLRWLYLDHNPLSGGLPVELSNLQVTKFHFDATDLCEPADADFQEWLAGIRDLGQTGVICP